MVAFCHELLIFSNGHCDNAYFESAFVLTTEEVKERYSPRVWVAGRWKGGGEERGDIPTQGMAA